MTAMPVGALSPSTAVGVVGSGTMGAGIAQVAAIAGHVVVHYGGDRYRVSPKIRQLVWSGCTFWGNSLG